MPLTKIPRVVTHHPSGDTGLRFHKSKPNFDHPNIIVQLVGVTDDHSKGGHPPTPTTCLFSGPVWFGPRLGDSTWVMPYRHHASRLYRRGPSATAVGPALT